MKKYQQPMIVFDLKWNDVVLTSPINSDYTEDYFADSWEDDAL